MNISRRSSWLTTALFALASTCALAVHAPSPRLAHAGPIDDVNIQRARLAITEHELAQAHQILDSVDAKSPHGIAERARLALYEQRCDESVELFSSIDASKDEELADVFQIAKGCARVTASTVVDTFPGDIEIRFQDELDRPLGNMLADSVRVSRDTLAKDLNITWPKPTRVTVVRDHMSLSAMTGLPYESAKTTGTVAVAKWSRVILLSPRAVPHGYPWRDTMTHELTHLGITRMSADRAPLWFQEGLAKREEVRWREPLPFDERPPTNQIVLEGMQKKQDLPLDKLGPSIAMLPSADAARVAFAEVTSFVQYLEEKQSGTLAKMLPAFKTKKGVDEALKEVTGLSLSEWDKEWRADLIRKTIVNRMPKPALTGPRDRDAFRLAELALLEGHERLALRHVARLSTPPPQSPSPFTRAIAGQALIAVGEMEAAKKALSEANLEAACASYWVARGHLTKATDPKASAFAYEQAVAQDPFAKSAVCTSEEPNEGKSGQQGPLCQMATDAGLRSVMLATTD